MFLMLTLFFIGLDLQFFIEDIEYVPGLKVERGVRMDVHAFDTIHNVAENGISIPPGKQTFIGMTLVCVLRIYLYFILIKITV